MLGSRERAISRHVRYDRVGISLVRVQESGCCGAISEHLSAAEEALRYIRRNIDAWWPHIESGVEAIVITASGCGVMVKEYGELLRNDPRYAEKARHIASLARDPVEVIEAEWKRFAPLVAMRPARERVACTLQHGQRIRGRVERVLRDIGFELTAVADAHLCCGSAGTYSVLQSELAEELKRNKLQALEAGDPTLIASANIGCLVHLASGTRRPVRHWIELLDARLRAIDTPAALTSVSAR